MTQRPKMPGYMRRYTVRLMLFMGSYMAILAGSLLFAPNGADHAQATLIGLALISAFPIIGVFWTIFRLQIEVDDEYQRMLFVKQTLVATALTLAIVTVWQFLKVYHVVADGPQWVGAIWFGTWALAAPVVRWRA